MFSKGLKWLKTNWPYLTAAIAIFIAVVFFSKQTYIYFPVEGVRIVTGVMATVLGIFAGLLGFSITSVTQTAMSERQYQQGLLRDESKWFKDWLSIIPDDIKRKRSIADLPDIIRRHSVFPDQPSQALLSLIRDKFAIFERIFKTWARKTRAQKEIDKAHNEFNIHYFSIAAIVIKIGYAEMRLELARTLTNYLKMLGFILFLYIFILILSYTTLTQKLADDWGIMIVLLAVVSFAFIFGVIIGVAEYSRIESRAGTFTLLEE